jgi:hypothetical protein
MDEFYEGSHLGGFRKAIEGVLRGEAKQAPSALWHALPALVEATSYPLMQYVVPRMKAGVAADLARYEIELHADSGRSFVASLRAKATDQKLANELLFIADRQCADAFDARELADRLAKVAS